MEDLLIDISSGLDMQIDENNIIKVFGVGGGGCNAVNYMYKQGIQAVSFLVANTDSMALSQMQVPHKLQLGNGLGAGGDPERAKQFAKDSADRIKEALTDGTRMVFITAGMGGGTGTGASPVVAEIAREMGILTVGIVTIPFGFEGKRAIRKAITGIAELANHTDALLVISNDKLCKLFPDMNLPNAFAKADEVLCNAAKSIAEIITLPGYVNTDFQDVYNTLKDGNMTVMNVGFGEGEKRITKAIEDALASPLVRTTDVRGASRILLNFYCSHDNAILMQELNEVTEFCDNIGDQPDIKWGISYDDTLGEQVKVTIIATGYSVNDIPEIKEVSDAEKHQEPIILMQNQHRPSIEESMASFYSEEPQKTDEEIPEVEEIPVPTQPIEDDELLAIDDDEEEELIDLDNMEEDQQQAYSATPAYMRKRK